MSPPKYEIQYCKHNIITNLMNLKFPYANFNSDMPHSANNTFYLVKYWLTNSFIILNSQVDFDHEHVSHKKVKMQVIFCISFYPIYPLSSSRSFNRLSSLRAVLTGLQFIPFISSARSLDEMLMSLVMV